MNEERAWDILTQIISGTVSGLIVVLAQKSLEKRVKKLEKKDEKIEGYKKAVRIFREMHINNSKPKEYGTTGKTNTEWRTLSFDWNYSKECDHYFDKIKKMFKKVPINDNYSTFVVGYSYEQLNGGKIGPAKYELINWKKYKEILRKSDSYFNYFENLKEESKKLKGSFRNIVFSIDKLNYLCSKVVAETL